jgi:uncharacterized protein
MKIQNFILGIYFLLTVAGTIHAASFDCGKAASEVEKIICSNDELSKLDESLNKAYLRALERTDMRKQTIESQSRWLKNERNACQNVECLKKAYEIRIKELSLLPQKTAKSQATEPRDEAVQTNTGQRYESATAPDEDITRSLTMTCDYSDDERYPWESISITQTKNDRGKPAAIKKFERGKNRNERETFIVRPGRCAECIYPSGTRVRVKVGDTHGECDEGFMSLWVNERKIVSRLPFAGRCSGEGHAVSFKISRTGHDVFLSKCHTARQGGSNLTPENDNNREDAAEPLSVCVDFPDLSKYPRDLVEYPPKGTETPKVGDIETLYCSGPVCQAVIEELKRDFHAFSYYGNIIKLSRPNWSKTSVQLPEELAGSVESIFDFNNDGKLDRVFSRTYDNKYMRGSVLLVQPGRSSSKLMVSTSPMDSTSIYLPFQIGKVRHNIYDYPPFSQKKGEAGFSMKGRKGKDELYFLGRCSSVEPFTIQGTSYIAVSSDCGYKDSVAVLKPLPDSTFQKIGLFRRVPENF